VRFSNNNMRKLALAVSVFVVFFGSPFLVSAAITCPTGCSPGTLNPNQCVDAAGDPCTVTTSGSGSGITLINPLGSGGSLESFLGNILDFVIRIGTIVVILMLVFVGFKFVTAQGSDTKITEARGMLLWTVVGALILLGAKAIQVGITATVKALGG
jgi:Type IV secretion system pilin